MRLSKIFVLKQVAVVAGLVGAGTLLSLPALASGSYSQQEITIAQSSGGSGAGGSSDNSDSDGSAYESAPDSQTLPDASAGERNDSDSTTPSMNDGTSGSTTDEGSGSGQGGADYNNPANPANPDSTGGEAFERTPGTQPLPDANQQSDDGTMNNGTMNNGTMNNESGTTDSEGTGSGQGGYSNPTNPTTPDSTGGDSFERAPGTQPLPRTNEQSGGTTNDGTSTGGYNQPGTTTNDGTGGGQGGSSNAVRGLW